MPNHTYKKIELIGSSPDGVEAAIESALSRARETIQNLDWFEVKEIRGNLADGKIAWYQVTIAVGFRVQESTDLLAAG